METETGRPPARLLLRGVQPHDKPVRLGLFHRAQDVVLRANIAIVVAEQKTGAASDALEWGSEDEADDELRWPLLLCRRAACHPGTGLTAPFTATNQVMLLRQQIWSSGRRTELAPEIDGKTHDH